MATRNELVFAWPYLQWGGAQVYFLNLMRTAPPDFRVAAAIPRNSSVALVSYLKAESVPVDTFDAHTDESGARGLWARSRRRARKIHAEALFRRHLLRCYSPDVLFHIDVAPWSSYDVLAAVARRNHTFVTLHTRLPRGSRSRERRWRRRWQNLVAMPRFHLLAANEDARASLEPYLDEASVARVPIAYSGVDLDEIRRARARDGDRQGWLRRLEIPSDRVVVTMAGQFIARKGCWTLLEAAARLQRQGTPIALVWLGTEPLPGRTIKRVEASDLDAFRYVSAAESGGDRGSFLRALDALTDVFALPSYVEGLPLVLIEAMAMGKATVSTTVNGIPEAIEHGTNGLLVDPGDPNTLAQAIAALAADRELRTRLGDAARATASERFDQRATSATTFRAYRDALEARSPDAPRAATPARAAGGGRAS